MNPPLLEVTLQLHFDEIAYAQDKLEYFYQMAGASKTVVQPGRLEIHSDTGVSYPRLRPEWGKLLASFLDVFEIRQINQLSLCYLNEIPLQALSSFQDYLNISFAMPEPLEERFEFFRSEFTYKYDFGEIKVWIQPDWDEQIEAYCLQLSLESLHIGDIQAKDVAAKIQELHLGNKDVFRQILSQDFIRQLPQ